jgi:hypothetical protein
MLNSTTKVQFSTHLNIPVKFAKPKGPKKMKMPNSMPLRLVIKHGTACKIA